MGAEAGRCLESICGSSPPVEIDWTALTSPSLHAFLRGEQVTFHPVVLALSASVCQHTMRTKVLWRLCDQVLSTTDLQLAANVLLMLQAFFAVVFSERIPCNFVYMSSASTGEVSSHRKVKCRVHYRNYAKEVELSLPSGGEKGVVGRLAQEVIRGFDQVKEDTRSGQESLVFLNRELKPLSAASILQELGQTQPELWVSVSACEH